MFGLSFPELLVICAVALVVIGPRQLPVAASRLGKLMGQLRRQTDSLRREFYNAVYTPASEISKVTNEIRREIQEAPKSPPAAAAPQTRPTESDER